MRAPQPSLQRLFGLAAAPAQRSAAWQALDAAVARLDTPAAGAGGGHAAADAPSSPAALMARLDTLAGGAAPGAGLVPLLDRLLGSQSSQGGTGGGSGGSDDTYRSDGPLRSGTGPSEAWASLQAQRGRGAAAARPGMAPAGWPGQADHAAQTAAAHAPAAPSRRAAAMPWPTRTAALPLPAGRHAASAGGMGPTGGAANVATNIAANVASTGTGQQGTASTTSRSPQAARTKAHGATSASRLVQPAGQTPRLATSPHPHPSPWPDAAAARQHWQQRLAQAGLGAPWQWPLAAASAAGSTHTNTPQGPSAWQGGANRAQASGEPLAPSAQTSHPLPPSITAHGTQALPERLASALQALAPTALPASHRLHAGAGMPTGTGEARPAAAGQPAAAALHTPVTGARVGGFKGLAALGLRAAGLVAASAQTGGAMTASSQVDTVLLTLNQHDLNAAPAPNPQSLIDQIEAALREQAVRNGISLGGLEPL